MGFLRSEIQQTGEHYRAILYYSSFYFFEMYVDKTFDKVQDAIQWIIHERCYDNIKIVTKAPDDVYDKISKSILKNNIKKCEDKSKIP